MHYDLLRLSKKNQHIFLQTSKSRETNEDSKKADTTITVGNRNRGSAQAEADVSNKSPAKFFTSNDVNSTNNKNCSNSSTFVSASK